MRRKKYIADKGRWIDHELASRHKRETAYTLEPLELRVLLSADLSGAVQALPSKPVETPLPAVVLNVPPASTAGQQTLSVAQLLALPISFFPTAVTTSVSDPVGQNQSVSQTVAPPVQNQTSMPTSDPSLLPQIGVSGQSLSQPPTNELTTPINTVPTTEQQTLSADPTLAQPISLSPSAVTTTVSETVGRDQSVSQTVAPPVQNQTSMPTSDSSLLPQIAESGQSVGQPPANQLTSVTDTAPTTGQETLSVAQILAQPISIFPSVVAINTSNPTEATSPPTNPNLSSSATTNPTPTDGSAASEAPSLSNPMTNVAPPIAPVLSPIQPIPIPPSPMTNLGALIDPVLLNQWQQQMIAFGQQHANSLSGLSGEPALDATYYDAARVFYQIADYTHDPSWLAAAHESTTIYRDQSVLPSNGVVPGYWNFTGGLLLDYQHTGDVRSKDAIILLSNNADFAREGTPLEWTASIVESREVAYTIMGYLNAETVGEPRRARLDDLVTQAIGHLDQWFVSKTAPYLQPFMAGLTMEALIQYNTAVGGDSRILPAIQSAVDSLWSHNWLPEHQAFQYVDRELSGVGGPTPAPDLNMLIAPAYAWMYHQTGNPIYQQQADAIFRGGVEDAYLQGAKQFNQNYLFAFDFMTWRNS